MSKPNIDAFLESFGNRVQDLEDAFLSLLLGRILATCTGINLDVWGSIVGESRAGRADDVYRLAIQVRVLLNLCESTPEQIIEIFTTLIVGTRAEITEYFPANFSLYLSKAITSDVVSTLSGFLRKAKPAGVGATLHYSLVEENHVFQFASGDTVETDSGTGFANDSQTTGGTWSEVV